MLSNGNIERADLLECSHFKLQGRCSRSGARSVYCFSPTQPLPVTNSTTASLHARSTSSQVSRLFTFLLSSELSGFQTRRPQDQILGLQDESFTDNEDLDSTPSTTLLRCILRGRSLFYCYNILHTINLLIFPDMHTLTKSIAVENFLLAESTDHKSTDMDLLSELENMAGSAALETFSDDENEISQQDIERWRRLFNLSSTDTATAIKCHRANLSRSRIADELWDMLASDLEAEGYDREAYEYSLTVQQRSMTSHSLPVHTQAAVSQGTFIVKLEGPLDIPEKIEEIACLPCSPAVVKGVGEDNGEAMFCEIDVHTRQKLLVWVAEKHPSFRPTIVRLAKAKKDVDSLSLGPMLGVDSILPQYRPDVELTSQVQPGQEDFPVWYFFYGTLADPDVLSKHVDLCDGRQLLPASIQGGKLRTWGRKYRALVDDFSRRPATVSGKAFLVLSKEEEENLRFYEGEKYEVVRCEISFTKLSNGCEDAGEVPREFNRMDGQGGVSRSVMGLTFRFAGDERELDPESG